MADRRWILADSWYAEHLAARPFAAVTAGWPAPLRAAVDRVGPLRGLALLWAGRRAAAIVTTNVGLGARTCVVLCGLLGLRRLVLLEYIVHPPVTPRDRLVYAARRVLLARALVVAHVLTDAEVRDYAHRHRLPPARFACHHWPDRMTADPPDAVSAAAHPTVMASGRVVDWRTFFAAAGPAGWTVTAVCTAADLPLVRALAPPGATVRADVPRDEHQRLVANCTVYVLALPETGASNGQIRLMNAHDAGAPVVAADVAGVREYLRADTAVTVPPGDPAALRAAVDALLADPPRRDALRAATRAGTTMDEYLAGLRAMVDAVAYGRSRV